MACPLYSIGRRIVGQLCKPHEESHLRYRCRGQLLLLSSKFSIMILCDCFIAVSLEMSQMADVEEGDT